MGMKSNNFNLNTKIRRINELDRHTLIRYINNHPIVIPTETVYGLAAIFNTSTSDLIYQIKNRPKDNPLIVHVSRFDMLGELPIVRNELLMGIGKRFWPGPLTILFEVDRTSFNGKYYYCPGYISVRIPKSETARKIIDMIGKPIVAPSANPSGRPSPTTAKHCYQQLKGRVELIIDG